MNLPVPEEEKENLLPKSCYFNDGKTKVDFVIVLWKLEDGVRGDRTQVQITQFVNQIKNKGLLVEKETGKYHMTLVFLKIHGPYKVLSHYANVYNVGLTCQNPYYKYKETILFNCLSTEVTKPQPDSEIYSRAEKTLSGKRPTEITTAERSKIVYEILKHISYMSGGDEVTLKTMLDTEIFLQVYPIHDGDCDWTENGPLTDRQLLFEFWASFRYMFREQPVHLIEKYYGPHISFYFALVNLYTKMLIVPAIVGTSTILAGFLFLFLGGQHLEVEVCNSNLTICSDQQLKTACTSMKLAYVIDNPVTIAYVIFCSFWGATFWNLWQRRQAMLRIRWNLTGIKADRTMRREFQENAKTRRSSITGEIEYYIPPFKKVLSSLFSYLIILFMLIIFFVVVFLIVEYRFLLRKHLNYDEVSHANEIELFTSSIITTIIIMVIEGASPLILKLYSKIIRFLTLLRMPRTQRQYNRMYLHMTFIMSFANHFSPLFYLAYIKGFFHRYPGDTSEYAVLRRLQSDLCNPAGCLVDLGMQLVTLMVIIAGTKCGTDLYETLTAPCSRFTIPKNLEQTCGQWEKDFGMKELDQSVINELFAEMVLQYSFITFFNASLPVIGLIALIHNLLKIRHDAHRFVKLYRRPILKKVSDIEGWNHILKVVTVFGTISNAFVVAFRTDFIHRMLYRRANNDTLEGYVNSTLSKFAVNDFQDDNMIIDHKNETFCYYRGHRYPPEDENKYEATIDHWHHLTVKSVYFIILENFTLILSLVLGYLIPEIPRKVKVKLEHDEKILKSSREAQLESQKQLEIIK